jgi:hypothetical protein
VYRWVCCGTDADADVPIPPEPLILDNLVHLTGSIAGAILDIKVHLLFFGPVFADA